MKWEKREHRLTGPFTTVSWIGRIKLRVGIEMSFSQCEKCRSNIDKGRFLQNFLWPGLGVWDEELEGQDGGVAEGAEEGRENGEEGVEGET